jgi:hypothetical protein
MQEPPDEMGIDVFLNCILVDKGIRSAMLVQPHDYGEVTGKEPETKKILRSIKRNFPKLKQSHDYQLYQGIIISKEDFNGRDIDLHEMGRILGYPCYEDYAPGESEDIEYVQSLYAILPGHEKVGLFNNACKNNRHQRMMDDMAVSAQQAIRSYPGLESVKVYAETYVDVSITMILKKLTHRSIELNRDDKKSLLNNIDQLVSVGSNLMKRFEPAIQYDNPLHQGILIGMLLQCKYNPMEIFYPLQKDERTADKLKRIETIGDELITSLCNVLEGKEQDPLVQQLMQGGWSDTSEYVVPMINGLINMPAGEKYEEKIYSAIQPKNQLHRGILISMLLRVKHNPFEPLFSLTMTEDEHIMVLYISSELVKNTLGVLKFTREKSRSRSRSRKHTNKQNISSRRAGKP